MRAVLTGLLGLLPTIASPVAAQMQVQVQPVMPYMAPVQAAAVGVSVRLAAPTLAPALPSVSIQQPLPMPVAPSAMRAVAMPRVAVQPVQAVPVAVQPAAPAGVTARVFDSPGRAAPPVSVDIAGTPAESMRNADRETIQALREFRKGLKEVSSGPALSQEAADALLRRSMELGLPVRIHASDLQAEGNHWVRGPHIHIGDFHIPVESGYVPTLVPGFANPN